MMIRTASFTLIASLAVAQTAAVAATNALSVPQNIPVIGTVPNVCNLAAPQLAPGGLNNFLGLNGSTLQIDTLVDPVTLSTRAASATVSFAAFCNYPHRVRIEAQNNGLFRTTQLAVAPPSGFGSSVPYTATLFWGTQTGVLNADAQIRQVRDQSVNVADPTAGQLALRIEVLPGSTNTQANAPLIAGNYGETLRIFLEPRQ